MNYWPRKNQTYYVKQGRRYHPVHYYDHDVMDSLPIGSHLITVTDTGRMYRQNVTPDYAPVAAIGMYAQRFLTDQIREASEMKPYNREVSSEQRALFDQFLESLGEESCMLTYGSAYDIASEVVSHVEKEIQSLLENPSVKNAYDHFLLLAKLHLSTKESK